MRIIVTGGAGFIGSAVCRHLVLEEGASVLNLDKLTYAANLTSLASVAHSPRYEFRNLDICDRAGVDAALRAFAPDAVIHLAAETHVDRSISGSKNFIDTNILGTYTLLEAARAWSST
jgi:dTDP-glucose 4,6-dehydratase